MFNKKAQGMPMNVVIIAIIVLVVLVIIIAFFAGGFSSITSKIRELFTGGTGQASDIVIKTCQNLCESAGSLPQKNIPSSGFCKQTFLVDDDGSTDTPPVRAGCSHTPDESLLTKDDKRRGITKTSTLGITCEGISDSC